MRPFVIAVGLLCLAACSSIQGTYVDSPAHGEDIGGLPIVVERARWLKVTHKVVRFALVGEKSAAPVGAGAGSATKEFEVLAEYSNVKVITVDVQNSQEVYAIDLMRPAAGSIDYELDIANQYPTKIKALVEDKTLETAGGILDSLLERLGSSAVPTSAELPAGLTLVPVADLVVKIEYYDLEQLEAGNYAPAFTLR